MHDVLPREKMRRQTIVAGCSMLILGVAIGHFVAHARRSPLVPAYPNVEARAPLASAEEVDAEAADYLDKYEIRRYLVWPPPTVRMSTGTPPNISALGSRFQALRIENGDEIARLHILYVKVRFEKHEEEGDIPKRLGAFVGLAAFDKDGKELRRFYSFDQDELKFAQTALKELRAQLLIRDIRAHWDAKG